MAGEPDAATVEVYDPRGRVESQPKPPAERVHALSGLRLGVLDNTKWNAGRLLRGIVARLQSHEQFATVSYYRKDSFSKNAAPELIAQIARENDLVLTAIGD